MILVTWAGGINRGREQGRRQKELEREERASRKYEEEELMEGEIKTASHRMETCMHKPKWS